MDRIRCAQNPLILSKSEAATPIWRSVAPYVTASTMPLDHFLPATYIAGFSAETNPVRRQRRVWVADKQARKIFETAASNVCAINDFYTLESSQFDAPRIVDAQFSYYEGPLANAINHLISGVVDAHTG